MELLERYVQAIGSHLPRKNREDIQTEIRSTLEDMLEDRGQAAGRPVDEALTREVLLEYGDPEKVAATYLPKRYLIGPEMYPLFWLVARIVAVVLVTLAMVGLGVKLSATAMAAGEVFIAIARGLMETFNGLMVSLGYIILTFAIMERVMPARSFEDDEKPWTPDDLMKEPDPDTVKPWEPVVAIVFTVIGLAALNLTHAVGRGGLTWGGMVIVPFLSEAFYQFLPWINALMGLGIVLQLLLLRQGRWTTGLRWFSLGTDVAGIVLAGALLAQSALLAASASDAALMNLSAEEAGRLAGLLNQMLRIGLAVAVVVSIVSTLRAAYQLVIPKRSWRVPPAS